MKHGWLRPINVFDIVDINYYKYVHLKNQFIKEEKKKILPYFYYSFELDQEGKELINNHINYFKLNFPLKKRQLGQIVAKLFKSQATNRQTDQVSDILDVQRIKGESS